MNFGQKTTQFSLDECSPDELSKVITQIQKEHPECTLVKTSHVRFQCSNLSLEDLDAHSKGKLNDFVAENLGEIEYSLDALYRAIVDECQRKSRTTDIAESFGEVLKGRAVTRSDAEDWLNRIRDKATAPTWDEIAADIDAGFREKNLMRKEWHRYCIEALNCNVAINVVRTKIQKHLQSDINSGMSLMEIIENIFPQVEPLAREHLAPISNERIKVMITYESCT